MQRRPIAKFIAALGLGAAILAAGLSAHSQAARRASPPKTPYYWSDSQDPSALQGFGAAEYEESLRLCRSVRALEPPAADLPTAAEEKALKGCSSPAYYYGLGIPRDVVKARKCAFLERRNDPDPAPSQWLTGAGVLTNIYANGAGVPRNLDLAIHMACATPAAIAEISGRVLHLQKLKTQSKRERFDYCDNITSGIAGGECEDVATGKAKTARARRIDSLTARWTPAQRTALAKLRAAQDVFQGAHQGEVNAMGTIRYQLWIDATEEVDKFSDALIGELARGNVPAGDAAAADRALNLAYRKALAGDFEDTTVKPEDVRKAQRAWLEYRDACVALARAVRPADPTGAVAAAVTRERIRQLRNVPIEG